MPGLRIVAITAVCCIVGLVAAGCGTFFHRTSVTATPAAVKDVSATEAAAMLKGSGRISGLVLLDVRTPAEYEASHLAGALLIDSQDPAFRDRLSALDRTAPYLVYCRTGGRSRRAADLMHELGFTQVFNLLGGIIGWTEAGFAVETPKD